MWYNSMIVVFRYQLRMVRQWVWSLVYVWL